MARGHACVPIYDTLGEDIVQYEVNHAEMPLLFVEEAKLAKVVKVLKQCPKLRTIVVFCKSEPGAAASAAKPKLKAGSCVSTSDVQVYCAPPEVSAACKAAGVALLEFDELLRQGAAAP